MAYLEVQTETADFRWILAGHWKPTNPKHLPSKFSGLVLEDIYEAPNDFCEDVEDGSKPHNQAFRMQFSPLIEAAKKHQALIASADPTSNIKKLLVRERLDSDSINNMVKEHPILQIKAMVATCISDFYSGKIKPGDWLYETMFDYSHEITSFGYSIISFRDLVMSHRASTVAQHQLLQGISRPYIVVGTGSLHICAAKNLELTIEERLQKIRSDASYKEFARSTQLIRIHTTQFDASSETWTRKTIRDQF